KKDHNPIYQYRGTMLHPAMTELSKGVTTGADGKLRLTGIGRERIVSLRFEGPTIEIRDVYAMTRPGPTIHVIRQKELPEFGQDVYHGATFDHAAAPTIPIVGTVRDKDTGKPIPGVLVKSRIPSASWGHLENLELRTKTDKQGRYRLVGLPRQATTQLQV